MTLVTKENGVCHPLLQFLPNFTKSKDKSVVLNVCGFFLDGYKDISRMSEENMQKLADGVVCVRGQFKVDFKDQGLFALDVQDLLRCAVRRVKGPLEEIEIR
mgnify:CR=1 FL=1